jgi:uncharacterized membrane protein YgdD (TMEM256/DUF423 family)
MNWPDIWQRLTRTFWQSFLIGLATFSAAMNGRPLTRTTLWAALTAAGAAAASAGWNLLKQLTQDDDE